MASLQAALKAAIQLCYQLEESELAVEPLPTIDDRRQILFYESAEGGAGVLHRLVREPGELARVAAIALELCHFDAEGQDQGQAPNGRERCEAACYDCLLSYYNQREHEIVDRHAIRALLLELAGVDVRVSPVSTTRDEHLRQLLERSESSLERQWLEFIAAGGFRLPSVAQPLIESAATRPDFFYETESAAIYIDGPDHLFPEVQQRDRRQELALDDLGYSVIRFPVGADWEGIVRRHPHIFGVVTGSSTVGPVVGPVVQVSEEPEPESSADGFDPDLFDDRFHELLRQLAAAIPGLQIDPGADVIANGKVIGAYFAEIERNGIRIRLIESGKASQQLCEVIAGECDSLVVRLEMVAGLIRLIRESLEIR
jgi:very-short-patch-repair endonuclease